MQSFSNKIVMGLKSTAPVEYPVHAVLMNFTYSFRPRLIENSNTVVDYLSVKSTIVRVVTGVFS